MPVEEAFLQFFTGVRRAPADSDGVTFAVEIQSEGETALLYRAHQTTGAWERHEVSLAPWKGQSVCLRFITDCGPDDNTTADHAFWGDVRIVPPQELPMPPLRIPASIMAWAGEQPSEAVFYFRDAGPRSFDLTLEVEGGEPVHIHDMRLYNAPDAMARAFTNGAVLANPSNTQYTFPLKTLYPGTAFRRIPGSASQDPETNSGQPVGDQVTIPPMDALFLLRSP